MSDLLPPGMRRSVIIILRNYEENLRQAKSWLLGMETYGILFQRKLNLLPERQQAALEQVDTALETIADLAQKAGLEPEVEDPARLIRAEMSADWASLSDILSRKTERYGDVSGELESFLDPTIQKLADLALEIASTFRADSPS